MKYIILLLVLSMPSIGVASASGIDCRGTYATLPQVCKDVLKVPSTQIIGIMPQPVGASALQNTTVDDTITL